MVKEKKILRGLFPSNLSNKQCSDTGMAIMLILLLVGFFTGNQLYYKLAIPVLLINMIFEKIFYPLAIVWFGISKLLGTVVSKLLLTIIYFIIVLPMALFRRFKGYDSLKLKAWKKETRSVLTARNHLYLPKDIVKPY